VAGYKLRVLVAWLDKIARRVCNLPMLHIRWLGAAGLECCTGEQTVLIDPYLSRIGKGKLLFGRPTANAQRIERYLASLPAPLTAILVGHTHVDHALDVPAFARRSECALVGSKSLVRLLRAHGLPDRVRACEGGERLALGEGLAVRAIASQHGRVALGRVPYPGEVAEGLHPPLRAGAYRHGTVYVYRVEMGGRTLVHVGSAHVPPERVGTCDVLFVCVSGWRRVPDFVPRLLEAVRPEVVVPFHWDDFTVPLREGRAPPRIPFVDVEGFVTCVSGAAPEVRVRRIVVWEEMVC
jgi:L-ascorbate metabolism protein UlaG (beta-lactamase superfamily)